ncbi:DegT/DnrJ/EryC1/StrS family aminotransferase [Bradyrhizobium sp. 2TAF24]|uniref:DegT/DnrJ/EryC1/StrS family aminotransferase n=1 Tax=Bradyrhizobium sp. 2TAF24 TaxID=3233011 RepID=UPI003F90126B
MSSEHLPAEYPFIPLHRPDLGEAEGAAAARVIASGWVSQGREVEAFEHEFAAFTGAPFAVAVSSGTAAIELALRALGIGAGDEVITVSHSFVATANAIHAVGAQPVFADVTPDTLNLDPAGIAPLVTGSTRAVLAVHQVGMPCDLAAVLGACRSFGLHLIEDAACAAGSEIEIDGQWHRIGAPHGDIACFSLHARKPITTGEGGIITCRDTEVAERLRRLRSHGMTISAVTRHESPAVMFEEYVTPGYNLRLSDIAGAIGRQQLLRLPGIVARRRALAARYAAAFAGSNVVRPLSEPGWARSNWQSYPVRLADPLDQRKVMQLMLDENIAVRRGVMNAHMERAWPKAGWGCAWRIGADCTCAPQTCAALSESERGRDRHILLPLFPALKEDEQDRVIETLLRVCAA